MSDPTNAKLASLVDKMVKTSLSEKKEKKNMTKTTDQRIVKI